MATKQERKQSYLHEIRTQVEDAVRAADPLGLMLERDLRNFIEREYDARVPNEMSYGPLYGPPN